MKYDFDHLRGLYEKDPEEFDKVTSEIINDFIGGLPENKREIYRAKQWRIEQELEKIKDPLAKMNKMVSIFWDGVNEFVVVTKNAVGGNLPEKTEECEVIDFKKKPEK